MQNIPERPKNSFIMHLEFVIMESVRLLGSISAAPLGPVCDV